MSKHATSRSRASKKLFASAGIAVAAGATTASAQNGGDTTAGATAISAYGTFNGNTTGFADNQAPTLNGIYVQIGRDVFYQFNVGTAGTFSVSCVPQAGFDMGVYVLNSNLSLRQGTDLSGPGGTEFFTISNLPAGGYFIGVDSYLATTNPGGFGTFALTISGTAVLTPVPEPATTGLVVASVGAAAAIWRRRRRGAQSSVTA